MIPDDGNFRSINWMTLSPCQNAPPQDKGRGFFVINGLSWMIFDVLVPIGFCLMWFLRPLTSYSGAYFQKHAFRLDETTIFEVFENSQTNSTWHVLMWFLRPLTPYSGAYFQKQAFRLDETTIFGVCENSQNIQPDMFWFLCWSQQRFEFFQEPLRIWIV